MSVKRPDTDRLNLESGVPAGPTGGAEGLDLILARNFAALRNQRGWPVVVGLCGSQGSGKSTLSRLVAARLAEQDLSVEILSIDDLYLSHADRLVLAAKVHPLLVTRGPPGTHDVQLGIQLLEALSGRFAASDLSIPAFDKLSDTLRPRSEWRPVNGPVDVTIFEGWCVGARPQETAALETPINDLEGMDDPDGVWRGYVNRRLGSDYADLFERLDWLVMLKAPSFEVVFDWRAMQERGLLAAEGEGAPTTATVKGMGDTELRRFLEHYQRLTEWMLDEMPSRCDLLIELAPNHQPVDVRLKAP
jgi:D-glycerate 3-kinase